MNREVSWPAVLVVAAAVAVTVFSAYLLSTWPPEPPRSNAQTQPTAPARASSDAAMASSTGETAVTVLGDSASAPSEASTGPEWPQILGKKLDWKVSVNAEDASGYISAGDGRPFAARVPAVLESSPDMIVVAGGVGDLGGHPVPRITKAARKVVTRLVEGAPDAEVVLVSPFSNGEPGPLTSKLSANLRRVAQEKDVAYVDATRWLAASGDLFAPDGWHPTDKGQQRIAVKMEQALERLELVP